MRARSSILLLLPACGLLSPGCGGTLAGPTIPPAAMATAEVAAAPAAQPFALYLLALTWAPEFCCTHGSKQECRALAGSYGADHLTLHGLWPSYSDAEQAELHRPYPQYCGAYASCGTDPTPECNPDPASIPPAMHTYGPGYLADQRFLANHEWPKHGSCTSLAPGPFFAAALGTRAVWPSHDWTPELVRQNVGGKVATTALAAAWRTTVGADAPDGSVLLRCDQGCHLAEVSICFAHDAGEIPTTPIVCPSSAATGGQNTCVPRRCSEVELTRADECG